MNLDVEDMKALRERALKAGTLFQWSEIAIEWIEAANEKIKELSKEKKGE